MAKKKNPLDEVVADIIAFRMGEGGDWASNSPLWHDSRLRNHWIKLHGSDGEIVVEEPEDDEDYEEEDYSTYNNEELRTELASRRLSVSGNKEEMTKRLLEDDAAAVEE